jgi:putative copper export protein
LNTVLKKILLYPNVCLYALWLLFNDNEPDRRTVRFFWILELFVPIYFFKTAVLITSGLIIGGGLTIISDMFFADDIRIYGSNFNTSYGRFLLWPFVLYLIACVVAVVLCFNNMIGK